MRLHRAFTALAALVALTACEKNAVQDLTGPVPSARIRFFNFSVGAPSVHFFAGDRKLSATTSASCQAAADPPVTAADTTCHNEGIQSSSGIGYGGVTTGGNYTGIEPGQFTFTGQLTSAAERGTIVSTVPATIAAATRYSYFQSGFYDGVADVTDAFIVVDDFPAEIDWSTAYVRFVNAIGNSAPKALTITDVESGQTVAIGGSVAYESAGAFTAVPAASYDLSAVGTDGTITRTNVAFENGFVYTIGARGDMTITSTTATNRPFLDNTRNR